MVVSIAMTGGRSLEMDLGNPGLDDEYYALAGTWYCRTGVYDYHYSRLKRGKPLLVEVCTAVRSQPSLVRADKG